MCERLYYQDQSPEDEELEEDDEDEEDEDDDEFFDIDGGEDEDQEKIDSYGRKVEVSGDPVQSSDFKYESPYRGYTSPFWRAVQRLSKD